MTLAFGHPSGRYAGVSGAPAGGGTSALRAERHGAQRSSIPGLFGGIVGPVARPAGRTRVLARSHPTAGHRRRGRNLRSCGSAAPAPTPATTTDTSAPTQPAGVVTTDLNGCRGLGSEPLRDGGIEPRTFLTGNSGRHCWLRWPLLSSIDGRYCWLSTPLRDAVGYVGRS